MFLGPAAAISRKPRNARMHSPVIWVDADSCPIPARTLICKTGLRLQLCVTYVANREIPMPSSPFFSMIIADTTPDAADDYIVCHASTKDLVITRDIPLAKRLVDNNILVINDRGIIYTEHNINERLSMRNFMMDLYSNGLTPEKTGTYGKKEIQDFANALDRAVTRLLKQQNHI